LLGFPAGLEIGLSPLFDYPIGVTVPMIGIFHFILGVDEGIITALIIWYLLSKVYEQFIRE